MSSGLRIGYNSLRIIFVALMLFLMIDVASVAAEEKTEQKTEQKRVLYISSYGPTFETFDHQTEGLRAVFNAPEQKTYDVFLDIEFMDTKRFPHEENIEIFTQLIQYKIEASEKYDAIVVGDDAAYQFALKHQEDFFYEIPIVFLGVNNYEEAIKSNTNAFVTGVVEAASIKETVELALNLTGQRLVNVLVDNTPGGQGDLENFNKLYESNGFSEKFNYEIINFSEMTLEEYKSVLQEIDYSVPIVLLSAYHSLSGETFDFQSSLELILTYSVSPIFHPYTHGIGTGLVGGKVISHYEQGKTAGNLVIDILSHPQQALPSVITSSPNQYLIDREVYLKYGFNDKTLKKIIELSQVQWINNSEKDTFDYIKIIVPVLFFLLIQISIIIVLIKNIRGNQIKQDSLRRKNEELLQNQDDLIEKDDKVQQQFKELLVYKSKLEESRSRYIMAFKASGSGIWDEDLITGEVYMKVDWYSKYIHIQEGKNQLSDWYSQIIAEDKISYNQIRYKALNSKQAIYECEYRIFSEVFQDIVWIYENGFILRDEEDNILRIVGGHQDITNKKKQEERIRELVYKDTLTDLYNKLSIYEQLSALCQNSMGDDIEHGIILIDIDNFKHVNDTFGHDVGDQLLEQVSQRLGELQSSYIVVGRFGGDEFIIIVKDYKDQYELEEILKKIHRVFIKEFKIQLNKFQLTASIGVSSYPHDGTTVAELLKSADLAMYQSKEMGKNKYTYYEHSMFTKLEEKLKFSRELYHALINGEIYLDYQPLQNIKTDEIYGFEALIRWRSKIYGQVSPQDIIQEAESNGLIHELGLWIFREAIGMLKTINLHYSRNLKMSINLSTIQFTRSDLISRFGDILNQIGVNPSNIVLEITESALIKNFTTCINTLVAFRAQGMKVALDDFGTGYSSLSYFKRLPIDYIKVDKSFIDEMLHHDYDRKIVEIMEMIAHNRSMLIVAEGVETPDQLELIKKIGYDILQGYLYSKPLSEDALIDFLTKETDMIKV